MRTIKQTYQIKAPISAVWKALTDELVMEQWGAGPKVKMDLRNGGKFSLWDGEIFGTSTEIIQNKKLIQEWWTKDQKTATRVTFTLRSKDDKTIIDLIHENVEDSNYEDIADGWNRYYLGQIKIFLEKV